MEVLYTRQEHGSLPVHLLAPRHFRLVLPAPLPETDFTHTGDLLAAITGQRDRHLSIKRYFGLVPSTPFSGPPPGGSVLDLFGVMDAPLVARPARPVRPHHQALTVAPAPFPNLGIDLAKRGNEVRKILCAGFGSWIARMGVDPEDILQDVFRGILARNVGKCPFDVRKSSFGHYVHLVASCVISNYYRREQRRKEHEQVGVRPSRSRDHDDQYGGTDDAAIEAAQRPSHLDLAPDRNLNLFRALAMLPDEQTREVAKLLAEGLARRDIALRLGVSPRVVDNAVRSAREALTGYRES